MGNMNDIFDTSRKTLQDVEKRLEMPRREFLQFCATLAATWACRPEPRRRWPRRWKPQSGRR
jgi:hypothetical protein